MTKNSKDKKKNKIKNKELLINLQTIYRYVVLQVKMNAVLLKVYTPSGIMGCCCFTSVFFLGQFPVLQIY